MARPALLKPPIVYVHVVFIVLTIGIATWCSGGDPGLYYGLLRGHFSLDSEGTGEFRIVLVEAETPVRWWWSRPSTFSYSLVHIRVEAYAESELKARSMDVLFPGPRANIDGQELELTGEKFTAFVAGDAPTFNEQAKQLYAFVKAAGDGSTPPPRHHPYRIDGPYKGDITHFHLGTPGFLFLMPAVMAGWTIATLGFWLAKRLQKPTI